MLSSRDGYCTLVIFDDIIPAHHTQQHALQLQSIAHNLSLPLTSHHVQQQQSGTSTVPTHSPLITPVSIISHPAPLTMAPTIPKKRTGGEPPLTPAASTDGNESGGVAASSVGAAATSRAPASSSSNGDDKRKDGEEKPAEPPKKKRRVQLTRVGDLGS